MPTLTVDQLSCVRDTPEWTADEVYLLLAVAARGGHCRLQVHTLCAPDWQGLVEGQRRVGGLVAVPDWAPESLVLAALLERDGAQDFASGERLDHVLASMETVRELFISLQNQPRVYLAAQLLAEMDLAIARVVDDDGPLGPAQLVEPAPDSPVDLDFSGNGGHYRLRFAVR